MHAHTRTCSFVRTATQATKTAEETKAQHQAVLVTLDTTYREIQIETKRYHTRSVYSEPGVREVRVGVGMEVGMGVGMGWGRGGGRAGGTTYLLM